jgi:hypothetical protein
MNGWLLLAVTQLGLVALLLMRAAVLSLRRWLFRTFRHSHTGQWNYLTGARGHRLGTSSHVVYVAHGRKRWWVAGRRQCKYVGRTNDIERRFGEHLVSGKSRRERWEVWTAYEVTADEAPFVEQRAITTFRPTHNKRNEIAR